MEFLINSTKLTVQNACWEMTGYSAALGTPFCVSVYSYHPAV